MLLSRVINEIKPLLDGWAVSARPDLPHMLVAPDMLAGLNGKLLAFFAINWPERKDLSRVLVRLALSRLGLPTHTVCVFVDKEQHKKKMDEFLQHFDVVVPVHKFNKQLPAIVETKSRLVGDAGFAQTRTANQTRYASLCEFNREHYSEEDESTSAPAAKQLKEKFGYTKAEVKTWFPGSSQWSSNEILSKNGQVIAESQAEGENDWMLAYDLITYGMQTEYILDHGEPIPQDFRAKLLIAKSFKSAVHDPEKMARGLAFAGWGMARSISAREADHLVHKLSKRGDT